jgi:hypothetical protein
LNTTKLVRAITALVGIFFIAVGLWALFDPQSFWKQLAYFPEYNAHLFHDIGAFQIGIGATLLLALFRRDALQVALWGTSVGAVLHAYSHVIDRDLGGKSTDPLLISLLALVILVAAVLHQRQLSARKRQRK